MKNAILASALLLVSQGAMADSVRSVVKSFERQEGVTCQYSHSSDYSFCLNYTCRYKKYYTCTNESDSMTLVLKINSFRVPGEAPVETVLESAAQ